MEYNGKNYEYLADDCPQIYKNAKLMAKYYFEEDYKLSFAYSKKIIKNVLDEIYLSEKVTDNSNNVYEKVERLSNLKIIPVHVSTFLHRCLKIIERGLDKIDANLIDEFDNSIERVIKWLHYEYYHKARPNLPDTTSNSNNNNPLMNMPPLPMGGEINIEQDNITKTIIHRTIKYKDKNGNMHEKKEKIETIEGSKTIGQIKNNNGEIEQKFDKKTFPSKRLLN